MHEIGKGVLRLLRAIGGTSGVLLVLRMHGLTPNRSLSWVFSPITHRNRGRVCRHSQARPVRLGMRSWTQWSPGKATVAVEFPALGQEEVRLIARDCLRMTALPEGLDGAHRPRGWCALRCRGIAGGGRRLRRARGARPDSGVSATWPRPSFHGRSPNRSRNVPIPSTLPYALYFG